MKKNEGIVARFGNFDYFLCEEALWQISETIKPRGGKRHIPPDTWNSIISDSLAYHHVVSFSPDLYTALGQTLCTSNKCLPDKMFSSGQGYKFFCNWMVEYGLKIVGMHCIFTVPKTINWIMTMSRLIQCYKGSCRYQSLAFSGLDWEACLGCPSLSHKIYIDLNIPEDPTLPPPHPNKVSVH